MLPLELVQEVKRLLDEGKLSHRKIAQRVRVSRGTVRAIATGRRGLHGKETPMVEEDPTPALPQRCATCGALVLMPCVYCRAVEYARRRRRFGREAATHDSHCAERFGRVA